MRAIRIIPRIMKRGVTARGRRHVGISAQRLCGRHDPRRRPRSRWLALALTRPRVCDEGIFEALMRAMTMNRRGSLIILARE